MSSSIAECRDRERGRADPAGGAGLGLLRAATSELLGARDPESLLRAVLAGVATLTGTPHAYLCLPDSEKRSSSVHCGAGVFADFAGTRCHPGGGFARRSGRLGGPTRVADYSRWSGRFKDVAAAGARAVVETPLHLRSSGAGILGVAHIDPEEAFSADEVELIGHFGQLAALSLENAHLDRLAQSELRERQRLEDELLDMVSWLHRSEDELRRSRSETITQLAHAAEFHSLETARHVERMSRYCATLASGLGIAEDRVELIRVASTLHDVGKIAIPDHILLKPGPLTADERLEMERHAEIGHELLAGSSSEVLTLAAEIAWTHHERFDGTGYPRGLCGDAIPLAGRIAAVADVFDALRSDRVYRPALPLEQALEIMRTGRGSQFDPLILDLFLESATALGDDSAATIFKPQLSSRRAAIESSHALESSASRSRPPAPAGTPETLRTLDSERLRAACSEALNVLEEVGNSREAIDLAVTCLAHGWDGELIVSVYLLEHERLWVISQHGYNDVVHDGFPVDQGVMARAMRRGVTEFVPDVTQDEDFIAAAHGLVSEVAVPFPTGSPVGVFNVETLGARLPDEAATLFDPFVAALAARLESMREGLGLDIASLARLCVHASSLRGISAISEFATRTFGRLLGLESAQLALRAGDNASRFASHWRRPDSQLAPLNLEELGIVDHLRENDETATAYGMLAVDSLREASSADAHAPWIVWLPLRIAGDEIGTLIGRSPRREIDRDQVEAGSLVAQHVAALIDIAQRLGREQRAAATDPLTGLLNRRGFGERFREELARADRQQEPLSLLMIDCDGLKTINDVDGHEVGDTALQHLAACIRKNKRISDVAARIGGDEFAIVLSGLDAAAAEVAAERIRAALSSEPLGKGRTLTASFGLALYPADGRTPAELLSAADAALYRAKREGGNRLLAAA